MNKQILLVALGSLACSAALAQAPKGTLETPPAKTYPSAAGGTPAATAQDKVDARKAGGTDATSRRLATGVMAPGGTPPAQLNPMAAGGRAAATAEMGANARIMDANGDGMISRQEWERHNSDRWMSMASRRSNGMVPMAEVENVLRGTPK